jgi:hypothetical protein
MSHRIRDGIVALGIGLIGFAGTRALVRISGVRAQTATTPFTLQAELYDRNGRLYAREVVARLADGTRVVRRSAGPMDRPIWARKITFPDGREVQIHEAVGAKTTFQPAAREKPASAAVPQSTPMCVGAGEQLIRTDVVLGQNVAVVEIENGSALSTRWRALDLGCEELGYTYEEKGQDGAWRVVTQRKPASLTLGEPDAKLFEIPATAVEAKPSEVSRKYRTLLGTPETPQEKAQDERRDRRYSAQP